MWFHNQFFATNKLFSFEDAHFEKNNLLLIITAQKMKFSIKDFSENCGYGHIYWRNP